MAKSADRSKANIAFLTTYPPRECGIATFSKSLIRTFEELYVKNKVKVIAVSDEIGVYKYSDRVVYEIDQFDQQSYVKAAEFVNQSSLEVVVLEHEYGIFGGDDGKFIVKFLEKVNKPVVTSLHSVLKKHNEHRYKLTQRILDLSDSIVVMTNSAKKMLVETFKINSQKIKIVRHGVPNVRFDEKVKAKKNLDIKNKIVLSTFGLINRGKGIETVIEALPKLVEKFPNLLYLVIGATHPTILKQEGESYRKSLMKMVIERKLEDNVSFVNEYLEYKDLVDYLKATDIYLAPQLDLNQAFSGTLSYAMGAGCAIVSSPTNYAMEILAGGRGMIVKPKGGLVADAIAKLLLSPEYMRKVQMKAYDFARNMIWPRVGLEYLKVVESNFYIKREKWKTRLPNFKDKPSLDYMKKMTDDFGIIQHADITQPDYRHGYSLDDEARALLVCAKYLNRYPDEEVEKLLKIYLNYLEKMVDSNLLVHNFMSRDKKYTDRIGSDASVARGYWALSCLANSKKISIDIKNIAQRLIPIYKTRLINNFVRPMSYALLGHALTKDKAETKHIADILVMRYVENSENGKWRWFDEGLTWGNAMIIYSLIKAYKLLKNERYLKIALESLTFLESNCRYKNIPSPIGQDGWYFRNQKRAIFDQQSIDTADMVVVYNELYFMTKDEKYKKKAIEWMGWFFGNNINEVMLYDNVTHGIFDGITRKGVNLNEGAESILVYLMAYLSFDKGL